MSEKTKLTIHINEGARMDIPLVFKQTAPNGVQIDWGDGTSVETFADVGMISAPHHYEEPGVYIIQMEPIEECSVELGGMAVDNGLFGKNGGFCRMLQEAVIGSKVSVGRYALRGCCNLETVTFTETFCEIGEFAFDGCHALKAISIPQYNAEIRAGVFFNCTSLSEVKLPEGLVNIWHHAFYNCCSLQDIDLSNMEDIGASAFASCKLLENVQFAETLYDLGSHAFEGCVSLVNIELPEKLTVIPEYAFFGCTGLDNVTIPASVKRIAGGAFENCSFVKTFVMDGATPPVLANITAFEGLPEDWAILAPEESIDSYKTATNWCVYNEHMGVAV